MTSYSNINDAFNNMEYDDLDIMAREVNDRKKKLIKNEYDIYRNQIQSTQKSFNELNNNSFKYFSPQGEFKINDNYSDNENNTNEIIDSGAILPKINNDDYKEYESKDSFILSLENHNKRQKNKHTCNHIKSNKNVSFESDHSDEYSDSNDTNNYINHIYECNKCRKKFKSLFKHGTKHKHHDDCCYFNSAYNTKKINPNSYQNDGRYINENLNNINNNNNNNNINNINNNNMNNSNIMNNYNNNNSNNSNNTIDKTIIGNNNVEYSFYDMNIKTIFLTVLIGIGIIFILDIFTKTGII